VKLRLLQTHLPVKENFAYDKGNNSEELKANKQSFCALSNVKATTGRLKSHINIQDKGLGVGEDLLTRRKGDIALPHPVMKFSEKYHLSLLKGAIVIKGDISPGVP